MQHEQEKVATLYKVRTLWEMRILLHGNHNPSSALGNLNGIVFPSGVQMCGGCYQGENCNFLTFKTTLTELSLIIVQVIRSVSAVSQGDAKAAE